MADTSYKRWVPFFIAIFVALLVAAYYVMSGRYQFDNKIRDLEKNSSIQTTIPHDNTVLIKCKNGESYEIVYKPDQTHFQDLVYDKCGQQGLETS